MLDSESVTMLKEHLVKFRFTYGFQEGGTSHGQDQFYILIQKYENLQHIGKQQYRNHKRSYLLTLMRRKVRLEKLHMRARRDSEVRLEKLHMRARRKVRLEKLHKTGLRSEA
jgi:hypothetical protein